MFCGPCAVCQEYNTVEVLTSAKPKETDGLLQVPLHKEGDTEAEQEPKKAV
jgi:hypothetical protein